MIINKNTRFKNKQTHKHTQENKPAAEPTNASCISTSQQQQFCVLLLRDHIWNENYSREILVDFDERVKDLFFVLIYTYIFLINPILT